MEKNYLGAMHYMKDVHSPVTWVTPSEQALVKSAMDELRRKTPDCVECDCISTKIDVPDRSLSMRHTVPRVTVFCGHEDAVRLEGQERKQCPKIVFAPRPNKDEGKQPFKKYGDQAGAW